MSDPSFDYILTTKHTPDIPSTSSGTIRVVVVLSTNVSDRKGFVVRFPKFAQ